MRRLLKAWPVAASAVLLFVAFPPFNLGLLVFVALAPWIVSLKNATSWGAFRSGYLFGLFFWSWQFQWVQVLVQHWTRNTPLSFVPYILGLLVGALYFAAIGCLTRLCWQQERPWLIPIVWSGMEVFRSYVPELAFPYGLLAMPLYVYPAIIQTASIGTIFFVSAWVMLANVVLCLFLLGSTPRRVASHAFVFMLVMAGSLALYVEPEKGTPKTILIGQLGVDMAFGDPRTERERVKAAAEEILTVAVRLRPDLVVLPEGVVSGGIKIPPDVPFFIPKNVPLLFGGSRGGIPLYQSAFAYDGEWKFADKTRLVIFGEYVPFRGVLPFIDAFQLPSGDLSPASEVKALEVGGIVTGPILCFEGLFPDIAIHQAQNGAQLLAVMSIDDWYMSTTAPEQLKAGSIWRAVETRLPLVRAASLGYSLAVDARGRILSEAPLADTVPLRVDVRVPESSKPLPTLFFIPPAFVVGMFLPLIVLLKKPKAESK